MNPSDVLRDLMCRRDLDAGTARELFDAIMDGHVAPEIMGAILAALATKGETADELVGAAQAMRARAVTIRVPDGVEAIDTCGTGGDGKPLFNVSTACAIVAAAAGATVAKHGNRSNARPSGSADVLEALGVNTAASTAQVERCLTECRVAFLHAQHLHPAMVRAAPVRRALGVRTIFNLLGPLTNPAGVRRQVIGVSRLEHVALVLTALRTLGSRRALVVHGREGLCDLSIAGPSLVGRWDGQAESCEDVSSAVIDAAPAALTELHVRSAAESARMVEGVLAGQRGPAREAVVFNTSAALWVAGLAGDWRSGANLARAAIDSGAARDTLARWRELAR